MDALPGSHWLLDACLEMALREFACVLFEVLECFLFGFMEMGVRIERGVVGRFGRALNGQGTGQ